MLRGALFLNGDLGIRILRHVLTIPEIRLDILVLNNQPKRSIGILQQIGKIVAELPYQIEIVDWSSESQQTIFNIAKNCQFGISVLFGHKIPLELIHVFKFGIINLHPSLLPLGKGADPVAWGILLKQDQGASIHLVTKNIDAGEILSQEKIETNLSMNAGEIYDICTESLYKQFTEIFIPWLRGDIVLKNQESRGSPIRKSEELKELRTLSASEITSVENLVLRLQALTYSDGRRPIYKDYEGKLWNIEFRISPHVKEKG
jgi:methionyl-tRNA formyltransferase